MALLATIVTRDLSGQVSLRRGVVVGSPAGEPVVGATVRAIRSNEATKVTRDGSFAIRILSPTDTLLVSAVGFEPLRLPVTADTASLYIQLYSAVASVADLTVTSERYPADKLGRRGLWVIDDSIARLSPAVVEPDPFRLLASTGVVAFSSVLSARPDLQGVGPDETDFTIDDHSVVNPFHVGRFIAAFPSLAAQAVRLELPGSDIAMSRTTAGRVAIEGKRWDPGRMSEIQYGLGAWSGITGLEGGQGALTLASRTLKGTVGDVASSLGNVQVSVRDLYLRGELTRARTQATIFTAADDLAKDADGGSLNATLRIRNTLIGTTTDIGQGNGYLLRIRPNYNRHDQEADRIDGRSTEVDVRTAVESFGLDASLSAADVIDGGVLEFGAGAVRRSIANRVVPDEVDVLPAVALDHRGTEWNLRGGVAVEAGPILARLGLRADGLGDEVALQPRVGIGIQIPGGESLDFSVSRVARLVHLVSDIRLDPKVAYYDYWRVAGVEGTPVGIADHYSLEYGHSSSTIRTRVRLFAIAGTGAIDLVPEERDKAIPVGFRVGRTRAQGLEIAAGLASADGRFDLRAGYVLMRAERDWGTGWLPTVGDRRHRVHAGGRVELGRNQLSFSVDGGSALPYTPVARYGVPATQWGDENSARGKWGFRLDLALTRSMAGPFGTEFILGVSVSNLSVGDQSLRESASAGRITLPDGSTQLLVGSQPVISIPPIPSVIMRFRW